MKPRPRNPAACMAPTTLLAATSALMLALGLRLDTGPLPVVERLASAPVLLPCEVQPGERGSVVQLGNDTVSELPRGARIAWATTGAPAAQGQWHWLAQPLGAGQALSIPLTTALHGSGCIATLLR